MKKGKVVHRIPKEHYLVSKRNRVFIDKKKEDSANACREKVELELNKEKEGEETEW